MYCEFRMISVSPHHFGRGAASLDTPQRDTQTSRIRGSRLLALIVAAIAALTRPKTKATAGRLIHLALSHPTGRRPDTGVQIASRTRRPKSVAVHSSGPGPTSTWSRHRHGHGLPRLRP